VVRPTPLIACRNASYGNKSLNPKLNPKPETLNSDPLKY
jgi:hypothetical protein